MVVIKIHPHMWAAKYRGREVHGLSCASAIAEMFGIMTGQALDPMDIPF